jgi:hypothetical protein
MDNSYIVRVYRNDDNSMVGVVENVETHTQATFSNAQELWRQVSTDGEKKIVNEGLKLIV